MKIFINYRRDDEANLAFVIANSLMREFGAGNVFFDRQVIHAGSEYPREINNALENCLIFIPIIGSKWLNIMKIRQNFEEKDYVLNEIVQALEKGVFVLPVLVDDTSMPSEKELPPPCSRLSLVNAVNISSDPKRLPSDIKLLINELNDIFSRSPDRSKSQRKKGTQKKGYLIPGWILGALIFFIVAAISATVYFKIDNNHKQIEYENNKEEFNKKAEDNKSDLAEQKHIVPGKRETPQSLKNTPKDPVEQKEENTASSDLENSSGKGEKSASNIDRSSDQSLSKTDSAALKPGIAITMTDMQFDKYVPLLQSAFNNKGYIIAPLSAAGYKAEIEIKLTDGSNNYGLITSFADLGIRILDSNNNIVGNYQYKNIPGGDLTAEKSQKKAIENAIQKFINDH